MPLNSAGFNVSGFNTQPQASGGGGGASVTTTASADLPSVQAEANILNHVDVRTYTNIIGKAVSGLSLIGGISPAVDTATTLPNPIAKYTSFPDARVGHAVIGYAKPTGTVVAGSVISSNGVAPSVTADGVYLAAGKGYSNTSIPSVTAKAYVGATANAQLPKVTVAASTSIVTHLDANISAPSVKSAGTLLVGNKISATSKVRIVGSATGDFPPVANVAINLPLFTTSAGALVDNNLSTAVSLPAVQVTGFGGGAASAELPSVTNESTSVSGNILSASVGLKVTTAGFVSIGGVVSANANLRIIVEAGATRGVVSTSAPATIRLEAAAHALSGNVLSADASISLLPEATALSGNTMVSAGSTRFIVEAYAHTVSGTTVWRCVNLHSGAATDWDYLADYITSHRNIAAVTQAGAVALIGGDTDSGSAINYSVVSGLDDLDTSHMKRIPDIWLGGRNLGNVTLTTDDSIRRELTGGVHLVGATERRVKAPRGIKTRYVQIGLFGEAPASLDAISIEPEVLSRRVR